PVMKIRAVHVRPADDLHIQTRLIHPTHRPGDTARLAFWLMDTEGKPVAGALSIAAVDEAVFHVLKQRPGMEETFFALEQELLEPVYAIYPSWSPEVFAENVPIEDRIELENALFARTMQPIAEPIAYYRSEDAGPPAAGESPITLAAASYPAKQSDVQQARREGLRGAEVAWWTLLACTVLAGVVGFAVFYPKVFLITFGIVMALFVLVTLVLQMLGTNANVKFATGEAASDMAEPQMMWADAGAEGAAIPFPQDAALTESAPGVAPVRVRRHFPETLFWQPQIITDDNGRASVEIPLADSITTWRVSTSAVSADGRLGSLQSEIPVFQPFFVDLNLPVALVRNDEVAVPVVVYNYL
ncbi:MAG: alpha-2-macroglobulin family protein, partial [Planctomycetaceae bacterium]